MSEIETITIDVPINEHEIAKREILLDADVNVDELLSQALQQNAEDAIHELYQRSRFNE